VVLNVSDIERSSKFWTEIMGFKFSDRNEIGMVFFRNATDHHTVALLQAKEKNELPKRGQVGFDHMALEVATVSELFKIRDFLRSKGVEIFYEGRRGPGGNPGVEFYDPDGYKIDIYAAMDQVGTDGKTARNEWKCDHSRRGGKPLPGAEYTKLLRTFRNTAST
jgi:catechol 2,3-dioxygenase